jgi:hypothetical protein
MGLEKTSSPTIDNISDKRAQYVVTAYANNHRRVENAKTIVTTAGKMR